MNMIEPLNSFSGDKVIKETIYVMQDWQASEWRVK